MIAGGIAAVLPVKEGEGTKMPSPMEFLKQAEEQRAIAERVIARVDASGRWKRPVTTSIEPATTWYSAEDDHQDYLRKHPGGYSCHYLRD